MFSRLTRMPFYAVANGRIPGIYKTWSECEAQVKGFTTAKFKKVKRSVFDVLQNNKSILFSSTLKQTLKAL